MIEAKKFLGGGAGNDAAGFKQDDARCKVKGFAQIVGDEDNGLAEAAGEGAEFALELSAGYGIERAKGLVHQENRWIGRERAGDADTLALAAGEFARAALRIFARIKTDQLKHFCYAGGDAGGVPTFEDGDEGDVFRDRKMREEAGILDDVPNAAAKANGVPRDGRAILDKDFPMRGKQHPINQLEESGLAAAAATEKDERFPMRNC
jgi:hypothetical protein